MQTHRDPERAKARRIALFEAALDGDPANGLYGDTRANEECYTPGPLVEAARRAMGSIDLDPASCALANQVVRARTYYSAQDDGLAKQWTGTVFLNPPYTRGVADQFTDKLIGHYEAGHVEQAVVLTNASIDTAWYQRLLRRASCICLYDGRVLFRKLVGEELVEQVNPIGQILLYLGADPHQFIHEFSAFGPCFPAMRAPGGAS